MFYYRTIDWSQQSLKAVLLHNDNRFRPLPVKNHAHFKICFRINQIHNIPMAVNADLKVMALILELQNGNNNNNSKIILQTNTKR